VSQNSKNKEIVLIIGAGPAGLTAAYELLQKSDQFHPVIFESSSDIGGISKTVNYKGNRIDIGGHRFFSKSEIVMNWWSKLMPSEDPDNPENDINRMMVRNRVSRIYYLRKFFEYPIGLSFKTLQNLGITRTIKISLSYVKQIILPIKVINSLEDFLINRFGKELYKTFFKDYTEKIWGVPCTEISPLWGAQRIKGLSVTKTIIHAIKQLLNFDKSILQKNTETSLIERFLYPKLGPGQFWEKLAKDIQRLGGEIHLNHKVTAINPLKTAIGLTTTNSLSGELINFKGKHILSSMPIKSLYKAISETTTVPKSILRISNGLCYRDFISVGLLLKDLKIKDPNNEKIKDNWIYIQDKDVKMARLQIFNNWSPFMVKEPNTYWLGLEFLCYQTDDFWQRDDQEIINQGIEELVKLGIINKEDVIDHTLIRMPKAYPSYTSTYSEFENLKKHLSTYEHIFPMGRNGLHRYNNADHSILTAMHVVDFLIGKNLNKDSVWEVNANSEYLEEV
jgi:protoporphyrinogen oxidase